MLGQNLAKNELTNLNLDNVDFIGEEKSSDEVVSDYIENIDRLKLLRNAEPPTEEEEAFIKSRNFQVLTSENGPISVSNEEKKYTVILDNWWLLVPEEDRYNSYTIAVFNSAENTGKITKVIAVNRGKIASIYRDKNSVSDITTSKMRREFVALLNKAKSLKASDIHIFKRQNTTQVRVRCAGKMKDLTEWDNEYADAILIAAYNMCDIRDSMYTEYETQSARMSNQKGLLPKGIQAIRLEYNPLENGGRHLAARILYEQKLEKGSDINDLGYSEEQIKQIRIMRRINEGINIISGPTGSGKSTTLQMCMHALIHENMREKNVITLEDPVEYIIPDAAQLIVADKQTEQDRKEAYNKALRSILRADPDVVMIGEIRDKIGADAAFKKAETGHSVWTSVHANDAISIITRLKDIGAETYKLNDHKIIRGLIAQRLIATLCFKCHIKFDDAVVNKLISQDIEEDLKRISGPRVKNLKFHNREGCEHCSNTGIVGRTVAAETIIPDATLLDLVCNKSKNDARKYWLEERGGQSMLEHAFIKALKGEVDPLEIERKIDLISEINPDRINTILKKHV